MKENILSNLRTECPWRDTLYWYDRLDSTNTQAKKLAQAGAAHGTVLLAGQQTAGRGRMGRSFCSPAGMGVYLSVILRPDCPPERLMHLTCAAGVAMGDAVQQAAGFTPGVKWINDLVYDKRKLGGILTEMAIDPRSSLVDYAVVGIGINCRQQLRDFPPEIRDMAGSLCMFSDRADPAVLAAAMVEALWQMDQTLLTRQDALMDLYRSRCVTLGQQVCVHAPTGQRYGKARDIDRQGALLVEYEDGSRQAVSSGEVSVRGLYGYI